MENATNNQSGVKMESGAISADNEGVLSSSGNASQLPAAANQQQAALWATLAALNQNMLPGMAGTFGLDTNNNSTTSLSNQVSFQNLICDHNWRNRLQWTPVNSYPFNSYSILIAGRKAGVTMLQAAEPPYSVNNSPIY